MKRSKILIIDDDVLFANLIRRTLTDKFKVQISPDAWSGMEALDSFQPDAVVLDIMMPAANGLSFLQEASSYADAAKIPMLVCSSIATQLNLDYLNQFGVFRLIDKSTMQPTDIADYITEVVGLDNDV